MTTWIQQILKCQLSANPFICNCFTQYFCAAFVSLFLQFEQSFNESNSWPIVFSPQPFLCKSGPSIQCLIHFSIFDIVKQFENTNIQTNKHLFNVWYVFNIVKHQSQKTWDGHQPQTNMSSLAPVEFSAQKRSFLFPFLAQNEFRGLYLRFAGIILCLGYTTDSFLPCHIQNTNTQIHKYTNKQIHKYTNTQIQKGRVSPEWQPPLHVPSSWLCNSHLFPGLLGFHIKYIIHVFSILCIEACSFLPNFVQD